MENYFLYFKGYKKEDSKEINKYIIFSFMVLFLLTFIVGFIVITIAKIKGLTFKEIYEISPIVTIYSFISLILGIFFTYLSIKRIKKENYQDISFYLDDNEIINAKYVIKDDVLKIKTWKIDIINKKDINGVFSNNLVKIIFNYQDKEYYLLVNKETYLKVFKSWLGSDCLE